jgi:hypothetical protein
LRHRKDSNLERLLFHVSPVFDGIKKSQLISIDRTFRELSQVIGVSYLTGISIQDKHIIAELSLIELCLFD